MYYGYKTWKYIFKRNLRLENIICWLFRKIMLKYGFCNKSFRKDEPLTSWTLFSTYLSSKLDSPSPMVDYRRIESTPVFWLEENLILTTNMLKKVFNWSEVHLSEMTCYKIHTLTIYSCHYYVRRLLW